MRLDARTVIPGSGPVITDGAVVVDGDTITYCGPAADAPDEPATTYEALMPGMWDSHVHFAGVLQQDLVVLETTPAEVLAARATATVEDALMAGVTSAREVGGLGLHLRTAIEEGLVRGPNIYSAGRILSMTGGHADAHGLPLDWIESKSGGRLSELCDGVDACLRGVRMQLRMGADLIKVCASGGVTSELDHPIHQQFSAAELRTIVEEAGRAERIVAAHCHGKPGIMAALEAGVHTIEHGSYLDDEAATAMLETDAILVPTRYVIEVGLSMKDVWPEYAYRKLQAVADRHAEAMQIAIDRGVRIAAGSDAFVHQMGGGRTAEVRHLIEAGMTPLAAIEAATATGPATLGERAPLSGQLAYGYDADIIAFDTNPIDDITVWGDPDRVTHVWKGGVAVKTSD